MSPSSFLSSSSLSWERKYRLPVLAKILIRNPPQKNREALSKSLQKKDTRTRTHERGANSSSSTSSSFNRERERLRVLLFFIERKSCKRVLLHKRERKENNIKWLFPPPPLLHPRRDPPSCKKRNFLDHLRKEERRDRRTYRLSTRHRQLGMNVARWKPPKLPPERTLSAARRN